MLRFQSLDCCVIDKCVFCRYVQRCPVRFLKSELIVAVMQYAIQATHLEHREANTSVMKFLYELVHSIKRQKVS